MYPFSLKLQYLMFFFENIVPNVPFCDATGHYRYILESSDMRQYYKETYQGIFYTYILSVIHTLCLKIC